MKTILILILSATMASLSGCQTVRNQLDNRAPAYELIVKKDNLTKFIARFEKLEMCAEVGMEYKKNGYYFMCENLKEDCAAKYDNFNDVKACLTGFY